MRKSHQDKSAEPATGSKPSLAVFVMRAVRWFDEGLQQNLRDRGLYTTTRTQSQVIGYLSLGETRPSRLASSVGISPQAMSQLLSNLAEAGLIEVIPDDSDLRARVVHLTDRGRSYLAIVRPILFELESVLELKFGRAVIDILRMVVRSDWDLTTTSPDDDG